MKKLLLLIFITTTFYAIGQKNIASTEEFKITGTIKKEKIVRLSDIAELPAQKIKSLVVTNHLGEKRGVIKKMRGVKILDILKDVEFDADNPKILSEYYWAQTKLSYLRNTNVIKVPCLLDSHNQGQDLWRFYATIWFAPILFDIYCIRWL